MLLRILGFGGHANFSLHRQRFSKLSLMVSLGVVGAGGAGCSEECAGQVLEDEEGHAYPCVSTKDCPRSGNGILCTNTRERQRQCIDCINNLCTLFDKDSDSCR